MPKIAIIGAGFSGLSAAAYLSAEGHEVHVFEKNSTPGGRARQFLTDNGYTFDMGPSWYWMPDVFDRFFADFGHKVADFYRLKLLSPSFDVVFHGNETLSIPSDFGELTDLFESIEPGSGEKLKRFMEEAEFKYDTGVGDLVYKPGLSVREFADWKILSGAIRLQVFSSFSKHVRRYFKDPRLISIMEFPVLFLGAMPQDTPALYSLMNFAGLKLGTWYPEKGFGSVVAAMKTVGERLGAAYHFDSDVTRLVRSGSDVTGLVVNGGEFEADVIIASADYHHVEQKLMDASERNYPESYWRKKVFAPSCLIYYLGITRKIKNLGHHTLFFEEDFAAHARDIYREPRWPEKPLFYVCCASKSDDSVAPEGHENLFLLMPLAPGLDDLPETREKYFNIMIDRLERQTGDRVRDFIDYKRSYCVKDFINDYNSYRGNAYGLANTLMQTAIFKPSIRNRKIPNLFYTGQLTVPGPGVPPAIISGKVVSREVSKYLKNSLHETTVR